MFKIRPDRTSSLDQSRTLGGRTTKCPWACGTRGRGPPGGGGGPAGLPTNGVLDVLLGERRTACPCHLPEDGLFLKRGAAREDPRDGERGERPGVGVEKKIWVLGRRDQPPGGTFTGTGRFDVPPDIYLRWGNDFRRSEPPSRWPEFRDNGLVRDMLSPAWECSDDEVGPHFAKG